jgi:hypothetical protein
MRKYLALLSVVFLLAPVFVSAQFSTDQSGVNVTGGEAYGTAAPDDIGAFIGNNVIAPILGLVALIFLVLTVYAGILWMTAAGNDAQVGKAKKILVMAVVGFVIIAAAYSITFLVFNSLTADVPE